LLRTQGNTFLYHFGGLDQGAVTLSHLRNSQFAVARPLVYAHQYQSPIKAISPTLTHTKVRISVLKLLCLCFSALWHAATGSRRGRCGAV